MIRLPADARRVLELCPDELTMQAAEYHPGAIMRALKDAGFVRLRRERPHPGSPFRYFIRRTNEGRAELGLPKLERVDQ